MFIHLFNKNKTVIKYNILGIQQFKEKLKSLDESGTETHKKNKQSI